VSCAFNQTFRFLTYSARVTSISVRVYTIYAGFSARVTSISVRVYTMYAGFSARVTSISVRVYTIYAGFFLFVFLIFVFTYFVDSFNSIYIYSGYSPRPTSDFTTIHDIPRKPSTLSRFAPYKGYNKDQGIMYRRMSK
jgi:hypothetical protein